MKRDAIALAGLLDNDNVKAFLTVIRAGEGTVDENGYRRHFGGSHFDSFADHPRKVITATLGGKPISSSAAGAYQFLSRTWDGLVKQYGFADFSPKTQDIAALALIDGRKALDDVLAGRFNDAVRKCALEWASLPGSPYGQPTKTLSQALATYQQNGGNLYTSPEPAKETPMPAPLIPIIAAVLPSLIEAVPKLGKLFGSGSEVAQRNVKAAEIAVGIVQEAVGAKNAQEAAETVAANPEAAQAAREAVESRWYELTEAGGGGIEGARKADLAMVNREGPWWNVFRSPSFIVALALLPLVYMVVGAVVGLFGTPFTDDVRAAIANGIVGLILGGLIGYYYGQTTSRNRSAG